MVFHKLIGGPLVGGGIKKFVASLHLPVEIFDLSFLLGQERNKERETRSCSSCCRDTSLAELM